MSTTVGGGEGKCCTKDVSGVKAISSGIGEPIGETATSFFVFVFAGECFGKDGIAGIARWDSKLHSDLAPAQKK